MVRILYSTVGFEENSKIFEQEVNQLKRKKRYNTIESDLFCLIRIKECAPSMYSSFKDRIGSIEELLTKVKNINYQDGNGDTFLHAAVKAGLQDVVDLLLKKQGIDINILNKEGKAPLDLANDLDINIRPHKLSIINSLNQARLRQSNVNPGPSGVMQQGAQQPSRGSNIYPASGLKNSLHGNIYQLKLLMLFLKRGMEKNYNFRLATEWDAAEKFDDLVFRYTDNQGQTKYRFLQAKHKQNDNENIGIGNLLTADKDGEFSLEKYFVSYLKIKNNKNFHNVDIEDFIICTNIGLDMDNSATRLNQVRSGKNKGKEIFIEEVTSSDNFFKQSDGGKRYKLQKSNNDLIAHLRQGSEVQKVIQAQNIQNIDTKINSFFKKLVFAVNQPNELKLSSIIGREIGESFGLLDADLITSGFQKDMLNWMKAKEGRFLTPSDGNELFEFIKQKANKLKISGPTSGYSEKLKQYGIEFEVSKLAEVDSLLNQNRKQILNLKSQHSTRLSAIKINQVLKNHGLYKAEDSYIFLSLSGLLRLQDKVLSAFRAQSTGNLLVIECKNGANDIQDLYTQLKTIIDNNADKKIILITEDNNALANRFKTDSQISGEYDEKSDDIGGLRDLMPQSQNVVLDKTVNFQGNDIPLRDLISDNQKGVVDGEILSKLINGEKVKIGTELIDSKYDEVQNHYIGRSLGRYIEIKAEFKVHNGRPAKMEVNKEELKKLGLIITYSDQVDVPNLEKDQDVALISDLDENFDSLCDKYKEHNVHWFKREGSGRFMWQKSQGSVEKLRTIVNKSERSISSYTPKTIKDINDRVVVITGESGLGKSTLLTHLAVETKKSDPSLWIVKINLVDYSNELKKTEFKETKDAIKLLYRTVGFQLFKEETAIKNKKREEVIEKLLDFIDIKNNEISLKDVKEIEGSNLLEIESFNYSYNRGKVVLLVDGFDEISPNYKEQTIKLMKALKDTEKIYKILVTTRPYNDVLNRLENSLGYLHMHCSHFLERIRKFF